MRFTKKMHEKYMQIAVNEAKKGIERGDGGPFGAVIVNRKTGEILAKAHNTVLKDSNPTHHAEINAIGKAAKRYGIDLSDTIIYSTVEPCPMCLSAIHWAKIPTVVFGTEMSVPKKYGYNEIKLTDKEFIKKAKLKIKLIPGILKDKCYELFVELSKLTKVRY